jgi:hypothetical protein
MACAGDLTTWRLASGDTKNDATGAEDAIKAMDSFTSDLGKTTGFAGRPRTRSDRDRLLSAL